LNDPEFIEFLQKLAHEASNPSPVNLNKKDLEKKLLRYSNKFSERRLSESDGESLKLKLAKNIRFKYANDPLSFSGNGYSDGRFHRKGINNPTLYFAENECIADLERRISGLNPVVPHSTFWVDITLRNCLNISSKSPAIFLDDAEKYIINSLPFQFFNDVLGIDSPTQILAEKSDTKQYCMIQYAATVVV
jgi:hypothetical protein